MIKKANQLVEDQKYEEAIEIYYQYIGTQPGQQAILKTYQNMAETYDLNKQYEKAAECCQKIIDIDPHFKNDEIYFYQGEYLQMGKMYSEAKKAYLVYLQSHPNDPDCNFNLGIAYQVTGQLDKACQCFQKAYLAKPGYIKAYKQKIDILKKFNKFDEILILCKEALKYEPTYYQLTYEEGISLLKLNRLREAFSSFEETIQNNKKFVKAYVSIGEVSCKLKENKGLDLVEKCLKDNKDVMQPKQQKNLVFWKGALKMNAGQYREAASCFRAILNEKPIIETAKGRLATCLEEEGNIFFSKKNFSEALKCYQQGLVYDPDRVTLLNNTGLAFQSLNNFQEAGNKYKQVLKIDSKNIMALNNIAALEHVKGNKKEAEKMFQQLTSGDLQNYESHINNGKRYFSFQQYPEALQQFQIAEKMEKQHGHDFYNDMAVVLQKLGLFEKALFYIEKADKLTESRSPLILMNKASILMNLKRVEEAKKNMDWARSAVKNPDRDYLAKLGINAQNFKFIFNQLNHYAFLMKPIDVFKEGLAKQILKCKQVVKQSQNIKKVEETIERAEMFAINQVMAQSYKETTSQVHSDPEKAQSDLTVVKKLMQEATLKMLALQEQLKKLQSQLAMQKRNSKELRQIMERYLPQSHHLRDMFKMLNDNQDIKIWNYGKQLYWILNGYLSGYMLAYAGVVGKGQNIDRSTFSKALSKVGGAGEFMKFIPAIGDFAELISNICGLLVDMEDQAIIQKMYEMISFNYDTQEELNDAICMTVMLFLQDPVKIKRIRERVIFDPPATGFFQNLKKHLKDIGEWFEEKKNQFVIHMRGFQKAENIIQTELAIIDVGLIISIMLNIKSDSKMKNPVLTNAAKKALADCKLQELVCQAYQRDNQNLMQSNNGFCLVMKCQIIYENPLLNSQLFHEYLKSKGKASSRKLLEQRSEEARVKLSKLLEDKKYQQILDDLM